MLLFLAAGWYTLRSPSTTVSQVREANASPPAAGSTGNSGPRAADFTVPTLDGGSFTLSFALQQGRPVILYAMAYWCGTCVPEAKALAQLQRKYGDRISIVALDVDPSSTPEKLRQFRSWVGGADYVWAFDRGSRVSRAYGIRSLDSTFIISQAGRIVYSDAYPTPYETLEEQVKKLL
jgi:thiol-disulfide isomerase/thioredoxin